MSYVAKKALKFGDSWIQPGEEVPEEEGRNYGLMLEHGEIVVHDDTLDLSDSDVRKELAAARKELKELRAQVEADEKAAADAAAEAPEGDDNADGETAQPEGAQRPSDSDPSDPEDETTEPPAAGDGSDTAPGDASPYEGLKQPALKKLLDDRKIEYQRGPVKNEVLVALLVESDAKSE